MTRPASLPPRAARSVALLLLLLAVLALLATAPAARADGIFVAECSLSHRAVEDPIVFPRMPGAHMHDFFGNSSTDRSSTLRSLRRHGGNCRPAADRSAYWAPTLYRDGRALRPVQVQAYYQDFFRFGRVLPFPPGLRMVAGDAMAKKPHSGKVRWTCQDDHRRNLPSVPDCGSKFVTLRVSFPDCWDGRRLDSPNHHSHMAYNSAGGLEPGLQRCPASHPVVVPQLQLNVTYPMHDGHGVVLSSGPVYTAHADFFNAWKPSALRHEVNRVLNGGLACDPFLGCTTISTPNREPVTARPRHKLVKRFYPPR